MKEVAETHAKLSEVAETYANLGWFGIPPLKSTPIWDDPGEGGARNARLSPDIGKAKAHRGGAETRRTAK
jgi:hypothetical protein